MLVDCHNQNRVQFEQMSGGGGDEMPSPHYVSSTSMKLKRRLCMRHLRRLKQAELMVLGFISLLLTFGQTYIISICIPVDLANTMLPCALSAKYKQPTKSHHQNHAAATGHAPPQEHHRRLLWYDRRFLSSAGPVECKDGYVPLISANGLHQLHIFIFFLAVFHVIYSCITMALGKMKIRRWKEWEQEALSNDAEDSKYRLTHETSFVRGHTSFWTKNAFLFVIACFFRQFYYSVKKSDYLALRHGFVSVHLAPGSKFDFQKYIKRSMEDDFKVVVGITPLLWASAVLFLLLNVDQWMVLDIIMSFLPLTVILAVGTKLEAIISHMAVEITERHAVVQGMPLVQVSDTHFWFEWPQLVLYLIHFVLFQNAFEVIHFLWIWYEFGLKSCFHQNIIKTLLRVCLGVLVQFMCSYITLPLYALVTQMGSTMKRSIFDEQTSKALTKWRQNAQKKNEGSGKPPSHGGSEHNTSKHDI